MKGPILNRISWILVALGIICIAPGIYLYQASQPTSQDAEIALQPMVRIPLESLRSAGSTTFVFQIGGSSRISKTWGEPYYVIYSRMRSNGWWVRPFSSLRLQIFVTVDGYPVSLEKALRDPYDHSSNTAGDIGLRFSAKPGKEVCIIVKVSDPAALLNGELVVAPNWDIAIKDKLAGAVLNDDLNRIFLVAGRIGLALLLLGIFGLRRGLANAERGTH